MSHYTVMVVGDDIEKQLSPFQENNMGDCPEEYLEDIEIDGHKYRDNPNAKWDWYSLGGRWSGMIKVKKGKYGQHGSPGVFKNKTGIDSAIKKDIANFDKILTNSFLKEGVWSSKDEYAYNKDGETAWKIRFLLLKESVKDNERISIVDCHI